jgi:hypothetical protein
MQGTVMTPSGLVGSTYEAADIDGLRRLAEEGGDEILDVTDSADYGIVLVVADES